MHLKSIEMVGFKSFADRTTVELKPGISGVVGPNGCGKSNIVDRMRWCLGEMSARSLRSKQMLDVIFAGASGRAPMNLAEVTLTFDNTHKILPIDFSEIQVTRKLFRSGESEYFLNRTQCRLKDIRDLFMDTGLHEGYSILAQGEVDFVMNAKPEERRELFEEAAGISKYKARREEALRKLEKVELDLNRLNDLISIVKEQMEALEAAARKAKLFQKVKEDLKNLEITDALHKMISMDEQITVSGKRMEELRQEFEKATTQVDTAEAALTQYHIDQDATEKELYANQVSVLELDKAIHASDSAVRTEKEREKEFQDRAQALSEKINLLEEEGGELEARCRQSRDEIEKSSESLAALKDSYDGARKEKESASAARQTLESAKKSISEEIFSAASGLTAAANDKNAQESRMIRLESDLAAFVRDSEKLDAEILKIQTGIEDKKKSLEGTAGALEILRAENRNAAAGLEGVLEKEKSLERQMQSLQIALAHARAQKEVLEVKFHRDPYHKGTQSILSQGFPGLHGAVGLLLNYPDHMAHWVESVLGAKINHLVFDRMDQAREALDWIRERELGRARCIILEKVPDIAVPDLSHMPNANSLLNLVRCEPALETLKKFLLGQSFLAGQTLYDTGVIDGGSDVPRPDPDKNDAVETFQNEFLVLSNLEKEIAANTGLFKGLEREFFLAQANASHFKTMVEERNRELGKLSLQEDHWKNLMAAQEEEIDLARREAAFLTESRTAGEGEMAQIRAKAESLAETARLMTERMAVKEAERDGLQVQIDESVANEHAMELSAKEAEVRFETFNSDYEKRAQSLKEWETHLERSVREKEQSAAEIAACTKKSEDSRARQAEEAQKILKLQEDKNLLGQVIEGLLQTKTEREEKNRAFLDEIQKTRDSQSQLTEALHTLELDLRTIQSERKNILSRMEETYQVTQEQIEKDFKAEPADPEEIARLKKRVESMSNSINLEAPEQHAALSERYNFLTTQTQDLTKAREDLKSAIFQINGTTREQFRETFTKVRENFRKIYGTLFEGGVADLVFTDESNLLETGIDIVAQPPGKKLQNIALLSGGEKALTAISLLFAFFMVKPSPFCVLDEVDAPWDPSNVNRFLNLVKEFTGRIQFLVVTHNPRTMEMADVLYGVTMQEFGISKILSMKLKKDTSAPAQKEELASV